MIALMVCLPLFLPANGIGDELILDEAAATSQTVGDFNVSTFVSSFQLDKKSLLDASGKITAGHLYSYYKEKGITSVYDIKLCLDVEKSDVRADYALDSIELRIEDLSPDKHRERLFRLGDNSLTIPGCENSNVKPEAQISANLGYDFMEEFDENSTEVLKFEYVSSDGERNALPVKVGVLTPRTGSDWSTYILLVAFTGFWLMVFVLLFRFTSPKSHGAASPA